MSARFASIGVVGAGAWGTALANASARAGREVLLWGRDAALVETLRRTRANPAHLPGVALAPGVEPTADLAALAGADAILLVVPAQASRAVAAALAPHLAAGTPVVTCAKGIERGTSLFMTQVLAQACPAALPAILSGPSFAADVAAGLPTAVTLAAREIEVAGALAAALGSASFRLYHSRDVRGVEIGGAAKNVLAIAAGIVGGRRLGASAGAALIARGFAELMRFGKAFGAQAETLTGLSGLGDLILTCSTAQSRNYALGLSLGQDEGLHPPGRLAEGALTAGVLVAMADGRGVDMPIARAVEAVLAGRSDIEQAIGSLLARPQKAEA
ncbi:NAD(P)-dependent glycerol-3-phosphate dehydrogenase [Ancylobacter dichloromethanicus]|uniref:Glycerol-3-phosphate dehydrogenase [NAD(P)+] n=1 Tax=Ancylobacter dichloromethanicus TaxID=518825 RepID=A0A9W6MYA5_9HYPH|nr:NAD(P)H-dependent glycerol-3-phosphate dehydrogenase [Ancylobacter dichloromethanicus]MBS7555539.1 NAD(P)-dependent glycerol-3-phosphate dehydrogenase [Ancylobacter dichloromethanicus]GLK70737.1 glycerol-3-phosphate dehydrogenase [NAD(P)+] [Ancylobacter dichloromethanicus]